MDYTQIFSIIADIAKTALPIRHLLYTCGESSSNVFKLCISKDV